MTGTTNLPHMQIAATRERTESTTVTRRCPVCGERTAEVGTDGTCPACHRSEFAAPAD